MSDKGIHEALFKVQQNVDIVPKNKTNPHYKSKYADLPTCWETIKSHLKKENLLLLHTVSTDIKEGNFIVYVETTLYHLPSKESLSHRPGTPIDKDNAQGVGTAITYLRRYGLALFGLITDVDDDGNAVSKKKEALANEEWIARLKELAEGAGWDVKKLRAYVKEMYEKKLTELTQKEASKIGSHLNNVIGAGKNE
jgi:hypothetical protein